MNEKNNKNKQELDKKGELRRLVLEYIGEKDIKKAEDAKLGNKKKPKFNKIEQIRVIPEKEEGKSENKNKINKEDIYNARKEILGCTQDKKKELVKKENKQEIALKNIKIKKIEEAKKIEKKNNIKEKLVEKKEVLQKNKKDKKSNEIKLDAKKLKLKICDLCVINIIVFIAVLTILLCMVIMSIR